MDAEELNAWLRLTLTPGVGNSSARKLLSAFGLPQAVFEQSTTALRQVLSEKQTQALQTVPSELPELLATTLAWLELDEVNQIRRQILTLGDSHYPAALLTLDDPPLVLYLLGRAGFENASGGDPSRPRIDPSRSLAIVGSRNPTPQGESNARQFAKNLAQAGLSIVSGLALGVDGAAHEGALAAKGQHDAALTLAVVGTGLDRVYPKAHHELAHRITEQGALLSEYPLGTPPLNANFPKRNRLIAGLSNGTLVVEAALKSGSLITARLATEQGKEVFAIPGSIHAAQSRGCHWLIRQGAKLVESTQDILEELQWPNLAGANPQPHPATSDTPEPDTDHSLLAALGFDPVGLDALQARTGLATAELQARLMALELDGLVARLPGGLFQRLTKS